MNISESDMHMHGDECRARATAWLRRHDVYLLLEDPLVRIGCVAGYAV